MIGTKTWLGILMKAQTNGQVNTAKMVRHGAGQLLVELVTNTDPSKDSDVRKRASAAFRNLLCVSVSRTFQTKTSEKYVSVLVDSR